MKKDILKILRCPKTKQQLFLEDTESHNDEVYDGILLTENGANRYPIEKGVPRFVPQESYADSFGFQWNLYSKTQLDSFSGHTISFDRFWESSGWDKDELKDKWVLDIGCGSGRFTEVALEAGANVVALDYSSAVDACYNNFKEHPRFHVVQGDIYELPLATAFSFVYCLGVLQHTPDPSKAFLAIPSVLSTGGKICIDFYEKTWKSNLLPKYWLRPLTRHLPKRLLFSVLKKSVPTLLKLSRQLGRVYFLGSLLKRVVPVANYYGIYPLTEKQHIEWSLLDTFDWFSPQYDKPQTQEVARLLMEKARLRDIEVFKLGHIVARGTK